MDKIACKINSFYERYPIPLFPIRNEPRSCRKASCKCDVKNSFNCGMKPAFLSGKDILDADAAQEKNLLFCISWSKGDIFRP